MLKIFEVSYKGFYMGGRAIVKAESEEEAIELVRDDEHTFNFEGVEVEEIKRTERILYNDNGDY